MDALLNLPSDLRMYTQHIKNSLVVQLQHLFKIPSSPARMLGPSALCVQLIEVTETINGSRGAK